MYVPLRVHGHHSLLTGVDSPAELVERARGLGLPALALADVDGLSGMVEFLEAAEGDPPLRPIVAAELSDPATPEGRLVALVRDAQGYRNLCRLVTARQLGADLGEEPEGPSFDLAATAARYQEGLTFLADHPRLLVGLHERVPAEHVFAAISLASIRKGGLRDRRAPRGRARNTHLAPSGRGSGRPMEALIGGGEGRAPRAEAGFDPGERKTPPPPRAVPAGELIEAARAVGVATLAVPDVYWACPAGAREHRVRVAIKHNALIADLAPEWLAEEPAHLPAPAEMRALYADLPEVAGPFARAAGALSGALARTLEVAEQCRFAPPLGGVHFPEVELPEGETPYSRLCALAFQGASQRYRPLRPEVVRRLDYELTTIQELGYAPYFLLVRRIADFARGRGIPHVGRGSAADSLVAYCLGLTDADPFRYRLPFERFLNPARRDRPDIDLDFCWRRRDEVLEHVFELFGERRTAMISTLNRFGLRSAFREAALAHGLPPAEVDRWSARLPHHAPPGAAPEIDAGAHGA